MSNHTRISVTELRIDSGSIERTTHKLLFDQINFLFTFFFRFVRISLKCPVFSYTTERLFNQKHTNHVWSTTSERVENVFLFIGFFPRLLFWSHTRDSDIVWRRREKRMLHWKSALKSGSKCLAAFVTSCVLSFSSLFSVLLWFLFRRMRLVSCRLFRAFASQLIFCGFMNLIQFSGLHWRR